MTQKIKPLPITLTIIEDLGQMLEDVSGGVDEGQLLVAATVYGAANAIVAELVALRAEITKGSGYCRHQEETP